MGKALKSGFALLVALTLALTPAESCAAVAKLQRDPSHDCCPHKAKPAIPDLTAPDCHCTVSPSAPPVIPAGERETFAPAVTVTEAPYTAPLTSGTVLTPALRLRTPQFRYIAFHQLLI